ncbi:MAG: hypothetical protein WAN99_00080, partial [Methanoculleus sp.]
NTPHPAEHIPQSARRSLDVSWVPFDPCMVNLSCSNRTLGGRCNIMVPMEGSRTAIRDNIRRDRPHRYLFRPQRTRIVSVAEQVASRTAPM